LAVDRRDNDRHILQLIAASPGHAPGILSGVTAFGGHHQFSAGKEFFANIDGLLE
jgi:hypothetical protein